jgi:hypothetical protein
MIKPGAIAAAAGVGPAAGLAGTAAMTASSTIEMKLRGRAGSSAPAEAAGKVLGIHPQGEKEQKRFATRAHWGYGTGLYGVGPVGGRGLRAVPRRRGRSAAGRHRL